VALTLVTAIVLLIVGWSGWTVSAWLFGGSVFAVLTVFGKGYWRPIIRRRLVRAIGFPGAAGIGGLVVAFNLALSALFVGAGALLGSGWRALT